MGEIVLSEETYLKSELDIDGLESCSMSLKGKEEPVEALIYRTSTTESK